MKTIQNASLVLAAALSSASFAGTMGSAPGLSWVAEISGAAVWQQEGRSQTFYLTPTIEKSYIADKKTKALPEGEVFLGLQTYINSKVFVQLGIAGAYTGDARLQGMIWDDADPAFDNYSYQYKVRQGRVAAKAKILGDHGFWFIPWISGSVGVGFNEAHDFVNTPVIAQAVATSNFNSHTKTSLSYTVACGIQKQLHPHVNMGVGYEYADWGKSQLARADGQTLNQGLSLNHLRTNGVIVNLTYVS